MKDDGASKNRSVRQARAAGGQAEELRHEARQQTNQPSEASRELYWALFDTTPIGWLALVDTGVIVQANRQFARLMGLSQEVLIQRPLSSFVLPEDQATCRLNCEQLFAAQATDLASAPGQAVDDQRRVWEMRMLRSDGTSFWACVEATVTRVRDEGLIGCCVIRDITERKQAEEARRASESLLARVQQIAHVGSWVQELPSNRLTWSDETYRIFGCQPQEFPATYEAILDLIHPDDRTAVDDAYTRSVREGRDGYEIVHRIVRQDDGQIRHVHERCHHERDASGVIIRSVGMAQDITDQIRIRQQLEEEGQRLREAQDIAHVGSWDYDALRDRLTWSHETHRIFGTKPGTFEETYEAFLDTVHPEDRPAVETLYAQSLEDAQVTYEIEHRLIRRDDGQERLVHEKCRHQRDAAGRVLRSIGVVHDITDLRQTEAEYLRAAESLRATSIRFQAILEHSPLLISEFDLDGRYLLVNPAIGKLFDLPPSQLVGKTFEELLSEPTVIRFRERIAQVQAVGTPIHVEDTVETDRGVTHYLSTLFQLPDETGHTRSIGCIAYDITAMKATTDALQKSEEKHRRLFETMAQGVIYQDADGSISSANPASERILGLSVEQMQGKNSTDPHWQMIDEDGAAVAGEDHPTMICLRTGMPVGPVVRGIFCPDKNAHVWLSITSIPLFLPGESQPFQAYAVFEDITERRQRAEELRESAERARLQSRALARLASDDAILTRDLPHAFRRLVSLLAEVLKVERATIWLFSKDQYELRCVALHDVRTGYDIEAMVVPAAGIPLYLEALGRDSRIGVEDAQNDPRTRNSSTDYFVPHAITSMLDSAIQQDGEIVGVLSAEHRGPRRKWHADEASFLSAIANLVAQLLANAQRRQAEESVRQLNVELEERVRRRTQELEDAIGELEAFSYSVSHDLRAPLRGVAGFSRILMDAHASELTDEGRRLCAGIQESAASMRRMIESLLEFSRAGRVAMRCRAIDMTALVRDVVRELCADPEAARVSFQVDDLPTYQGDRELLRRVWTNLLANSVKFSSGRERPVIKVGTKDEAGEVVYYVQDNGAGFDMRFADKLFGVFRRLHSSKDFEGTGVGLAIVQRIVKRHGGRIWGQGEPDKGATFSFTLGEQD